MRFVHLGHRTPWGARRLASLALSCLALAGALGATSMTPAAATTLTAPLTWTAGTPLVGASGGVNAVSCATATQNVAVAHDTALTPPEAPTSGVPAVHVTGAVSVAAATGVNDVAPCTPASARHDRASTARRQAPHGVR